MDTVALHTRLKAGCEEEYERVHRVIPPDLDTALRAAGVRGWRIWRDGRDLFHLVTVEDYRTMRRELRDHPANVAWQARVGPLHDVPDSYEGDDDGIRSVWGLPGEPTFPDEVVALFAKLRAPLPRYPAHLLAGMAPVRPWVWSTEPDVPSPYDLESHIAAATADRPDFALVGHAGHGVNSYALHFYLVDGPLAAFVQVGYGGVYMDDDDVRLAMVTHLAQLERVQAAVRSAAGAGRIGVGTERLLYVDSEFHGSRATWLGGGFHGALSWSSRDRAGYDTLVRHLESRTPGLPGWGDAYPGKA